MNYSVQGNVLTLENGVVRIFKTAIRQVIATDEAWVILLEEEIANNVIGLKPDGALFWRLKPTNGAIFIQHLEQQQTSVYCESREGCHYLIHPSNGTLEKLG